jgi:membrane associated rhomboid family serine protease
MVFPIGDENPRRENVPYANIALVAINAIVFISMLTLSQPQLERFVYRFGTVPAEILHGQGYYTLITSQFVHGGFLHVVGNLIFLWVFGDNIERALGHGLYVAFYLGAGVLAGLAHVLMNPESTIPSIGASGAIAAILGAYIILFPARQIRVLVLVMTTRVPAFIFLGVWAALQLFTGLASLGVQTVESGGVAVWAHVGGFAIGLAAGFGARRAGWQGRA